MLWSIFAISLMHSHEYKLTIRNNSGKINLIFSPQSLGKVKSSYIRLFKLIFRDVCCDLEFVCVCTYIHTYTCFHIYDCVYIYTKYIVVSVEYGNTHMHIFAQAHTNPSYVQERYFYYKNLYVVCEFQ